jgi:tetratricopeptide (TPR) repeat protein
MNRQDAFHVGPMARPRTRLGWVFRWLKLHELMMRRRLILVLVSGLSLATWVSVRIVAGWQLARELGQARREINARRLGEASARLSRLAERWPGRGEVEYWLGVSEMLVGHADLALAAWGRVSGRAPEGPLAALARGRLAMECGRYGLAEACLESASHLSKDVGVEARRLLGRLYWVTGRNDDYRRALQWQVDHEIDASTTIRTLWSVDTVPYPVEAMRQAIEKARQAAPDDDRVWLALANLATRAGRLEEADNWLRQCEQARPDDHPVWLARLEWAESAGRVDELQRAATHLPRSCAPRARCLALKAWLAGRRDDRKAERSALEKLIDLEPGDTAALERLADLCAQDGERERVAELRDRKAILDAAHEHYRRLMNLPDLAPHALEMARAAEALDRRFDARVWWMLAARHAPTAESDAALARLTDAGPEASLEPDDRTLAEFLAPDLSTERDRVRDLGASSIPEFSNEAERRGLVFRFDCGKSDRRQLPETMSGGVAVLDYDGDGWLDVYALQGGPFPPREDRPASGDRLFRNRGDGWFEDATAASGLAALPGGYGLGVAVGDYDNDGRPDLFITRWRSYALYHNVGHGRFEDTTVAAGLGGDRDCPTSAAWADLDNDGDLDLYVCHYLKWDSATAPTCQDPPHPGNTYCDPRHFPALPDHVFRNDGGRFVDVTEEAGISDHDGRGLGVVAADLDGDGKADLFVANDTSANYFFHNRGGFHFTEEGLASGLATNAGGGYLAGMGVACGDFDGDGMLDLAVTNFYGESTTLYHNLGHGLFSDRTTAVGLQAPTRFALGFGIAALDANNDGRLDLAQANGHINDYRPATPYAMPAQLFLGDPAGRLIEVSRRAGSPWQQARVGRGLAVGDLDNDGRLDLLLVASDAPLVFLRNRSTSPTHFLTLGLEGTASNRDAVGARVVVTTSGRTQVVARVGGGSYLSSSDQRLHIGLGLARMVDRVEVVWPSGSRNSYAGLVADHGYRLREGDSVPQPLPGFSSVPAR